MVLKAILSSLDGLSDAVSTEYDKGEDDRFYLQVDAVDGHALEDVAGIKKVLSEAKTERDSLKVKLHKFDGIDSEAAKTAIAKLAEVGNDPEGQIKARVDSQVTQITEKFQKQIGDLEVTVNQRDKTIHELVIDDAALKALTQHKLIEGGSDLLMPHVVKELVVGKDSAGRPVAFVSDGKGGTKISMRKGTTDEPMDVDELVESMKEQTMFKAAFAGIGLNGTDSHTRRPGSTTNDNNRDTETDDASNPVTMLQRGFQTNSDAK